MTADTEKCTICGQDVEYIQHMKVRHEVDENVAAALRALQRRTQRLEEKVDLLNRFAAEIIDFIELTGTSDFSSSVVA